MPAIEQWGIILGVAAGVITGIRWLYAKTSPSGPAITPGPQPWPADGQPAAQQLPPPRLWVGFIGAGGTSWWGQKYWVCSHDHAYANDAVACARDHLANSMWDGRKTGHG